MRTVVALLQSLEHNIGNTDIGEFLLLQTAEALEDKADINARPASFANCCARPFLKWAGGKGQLISEIRKFYPFERYGIRRYAEPFVGGGAVLIDILGRYELDEVYISDTNAELIGAYRAIKENASALIENLFAMQEEFLRCDEAARKTYYMEKRERFNQLKTEGGASPSAGKNSIEMAALLIFLNRTCFNGLYRVNRKGLFNVPMGAYKRPTICDAENILKLSHLLRNVIIAHADYKKSARFIDADTFVYFDPPYRPLSETATFTSYSENGFGDREQIELARYADKVCAIGAKVLLSNSDPKNENPSDDFFDNLYAGYNIKRVKAARMINCRSELRGKIKELLISNFCETDAE